MKTVISRLTLISVFLLTFSAGAFAHCEIPCGIYDDEARIKLIAEHIATIEKSMNKIQEIEKAEHHDANQLVRWIMNKENHANMLQDIVTQYFMTQRLKVGAKMYDQQLTLLHQLLIAAMKTKQTTDLEFVAELKTLLTQFEKLYFAPH